jgi:flagellar basal body rod protein FlgC
MSHYYSDHDLEQLGYDDTAISVYRLEIRRQEMEDVVSELLTAMQVPGDVDSKLFQSELAHVMNQVHRTKQQRLYSLCVNVLKVFADQYHTHNYDPRNDFSCERSAAIMDIVHDAYAPYI